MYRTSVWDRDTQLWSDTVKFSVSQCITARYCTGIGRWRWRQLWRLINTDRRHSPVHRWPVTWPIDSTDKYLHRAWYGFCLVPDMTSLCRIYRRQPVRTWGVTESAKTQRIKAFTELITWIAGCRVTAPKACWLLRALTRQNYNWQAGRRWRHSLHSVAPSGNVPVAEQGKRWP